MSKFSSEHVEKKKPLGNLFRTLVRNFDSPNYPNYADNNEIFVIQIHFP